MDEPARLPAVSISYPYAPTCEPLNGKDDSNRRLSHQALPGRLRICNFEAAARVSMCGNCKVSEGTRWIHILVFARGFCRPLARKEDNPSSGMMRHTAEIMQPRGQLKPSTWQSRGASHGASEKSPEVTRTKVAYAQLRG